MARSSLFTVAFAPVVLLTLAPLGDAAAQRGNRPPMIRLPARTEIPEGMPWSGRISAPDPEGSPVTISVSGLPPGARWLPHEGRVTFTPDFIQGGYTWPVTVTASDGQAVSEGRFNLTVFDTLKPPEPRVLSEERVGSCTVLKMHQITDVFLDEERKAGRGIPAAVAIPNRRGPHPVKITLHGFGGGPRARCDGRSIVIAPYDPQNSYWWGHGQHALGGVGAPDYTARRVLHLLEWVLKNVDGADPQRVYVSGHSMGGAGAATIGLLHSRHFAWIHAREGQSVPRNHRPSRLMQLKALWGPIVPDARKRHGIWDHMDLTRIVTEQPDARDQFISLEHGKDDPVIHFGAAVQPSPLTGLNLYQALQKHHVGHFASWDEGGHGPPDPILGHRWWTEGWHPIFDEVTFLRRDLAFPAFSGFSLDGNPGGFVGNGTLLWHEETGYAGDHTTAGDTGWEGDIAGALNRFLRWDATTIVDTPDRFEIAFKLVDGRGGPAPRSGYPTTGDRLPEPKSGTVSVTPRRVQAFLCTPGEKVRWRLQGDSKASGHVTAGDDGSITVPDLPVNTQWQRLVLSRR